MTFASFEFLVFFTVVFCCYFCVPASYKWIFLLASGYFFYGWYRLEFLPLLIIPTIIIYFMALRITAAESLRSKRMFLAAGMGVGLLPLLVFKYLDFFGAVVYKVVDQFVEVARYNPLNLTLPLGLSFYTFKLIGYLIDVYRGNEKAEHHLGYLALYVSFFPQLLAGPIDRAVHFIPGLKQKVYFDYYRVMDGFKTITWGFFKKLVIADRLGVIVDGVYTDVYAHNGPVLVTAVLFYSFQVYCDFSAYSDIAVGISKVLGFKSMENFNSPYFSKSITKFWNTWHISLSTWLRDYLFLPISFAVMRKIKTEKFMKIKAETWGYITGMTFTMFLGGLWHGAKWTLVLWGGLHGIYLVFSYITKKARKKLVKKTGLKKFPVFHRFIRIFITFGLVSFAWIFFRADSIHSAFYIIIHLFSGTLEFFGKVLGSLIFHFDLSPLRNLLKGMGIQPYDFFVIISALFILGIVDHAKQKGDIWEKLKTRPVLFRFGVYYLLIMSIFLFSRPAGGQFIYFKF